MLKSRIVLDTLPDTWYVIDTRVYDNQTYYLLENEVFGDDIPWVIVDSNMNIVLLDVYNGWDDFEYAMDMDEFGEG